MPELSVTNNPLSFFSSTIFLSMNLNGQILAFPLLLFLPPVISPTLPHKHQEKPDLLICKISFFFFQTIDYQRGKALEKRLDYDSLVSEDLRFSFLLRRYKTLDT